MERSKTDRRVKYTMMVIRNSFIQLLKQKPIAKITIKEICENADINRATFYAHFSDPYDLLHQIEHDLIDDINQYLNTYDFKNTPETSGEMLKKILLYIGENSELINLLMNSNGDIQFQKEIINVIGEQQMLPTAVSNCLSKEDADFAFLFFANGCIGIIKQWLKSGMKKPAGEMAELMLKLVLKGRKSLSDL